MEEIERGERTEKAGLEDQDQAEVEVRLMMHAVRGIDRHERDDGGEHQHERAQAVDAKMILDAERRRPGDALDHAHAAVGRQAGPDEERKAQACDGCEEGHGARVFAGEERGSRADKGHHGQERQYVKAGRIFVHGRALQIRIAASATTASARILR